MSGRWTQIGFRRRRPGRSGGRDGAGLHQPPTRGRVRDAGYRPRRWPRQDMPSRVATSCGAQLRRAGSPRTGRRARGGDAPATQGRAVASGVSTHRRPRVEQARPARYRAADAGGRGGLWADDAARCRGCHVVLLALAAGVGARSARRPPGDGRSGGCSVTRTDVASVIGPPAALRVRVRGPGRQAAAYRAPLGVSAGPAASSGAHTPRVVSPHRGVRASAPGRSRVGRAWWSGAVQVGG